MFMFWLLLFITLIIVEIVTINLVSIWFAIGALSSCIVSLFTDNVYIQFLIFTIVSIISLIITKPLMKKIKNKEHIATNLDRIIGKVGIVTLDIIPNSIGEVKVDGKKWSAISKSKILAGSTVKIIKIDGVKILVEECKED